MMEDFTWDGIVRAIREDERKRIWDKLEVERNRAVEDQNWERAAGMRDAMTLLEEAED